MVNYLLSELKKELIFLALSIFLYNFGLNYTKKQKTMANKRKLKKQINYVCGELFAECLAASSYSGRSDNGDNLQPLLKTILHTHSDYIMRVSHPEPGMKPKKYYKALIASFTNDVNEIVDGICNMLG